MKELGICLRYLTIIRVDRQRTEGIRRDSRRCRFLAHRRELRNRERSFERLARSRLTSEKEKMGAYIPKQVIDEISRNREQKLALGGKTVRLTILFADVRGFTAHD